MANEALVEVFADPDAFTLQELKDYRRNIAVNIAKRSVDPVEITSVRRDGRETEGIILTTYQEKLDVLQAIRAAIYRHEHDGRSHPDSGGTSYDFSAGIVDP